MVENKGGEFETNKLYITCKSEEDKLRFIEEIQESLRQKKEVARRRRSSLSN